MQANPYVSEHIARRRSQAAADEATRFASSAYDNMTHIDSQEADEGIVISLSDLAAMVWWNINSCTSLWLSL